MTSKSKAPVIAGITAIALAVIKFIIGFLSGSMSVLGSAIDSMVDFMVSIFNYFAIKKAADNPDNKFNYGYGKIEALMATAEGLLITIIGCFIFYFSIDKLISGKHDVKIDAAIYVMVFSFIITGVLIYYLNDVAKKTNSLVIKADALHYKTDFFTNLGIIFSLIMIKLTGFVILDAIIGIFISVYIVYSAVRLMKESVYVLMDGALDKNVVDDIINHIKTHNEINSFHYLRTRKSADTCFFSAHLVFNKTITLLAAHNIGNEIEDYINKKYYQYKWIIDLHFDPEDDSVDL